MNSSIDLDSIEGQFIISANVRSIYREYIHVWSCIYPKKKKHASIGAGQHDVACWGIVLANPVQSVQGLMKPRLLQEETSALLSCSKSNSWSVTLLHYNCKQVSWIIHHISICLDSEIHKQKPLSSVVTVGRDYTYYTMATLAPHLLGEIRGVRTQRRVGVVGPVTPGAAGQAVLVKHASGSDDPAAMGVDALGLNSVEFSYQLIISLV